MRRENEIENFAIAMYNKYGDSHPTAEYLISCYEACIPKTFWNVSSEDVVHNVDVFNRVVIPYRKKWKQALRNGYSILFLGDSGLGKTFFISYILTQMIKRNLTVYYTTLTQFDMDIKRGFHDSNADQRLELMLESDFVSIDEIGKQYVKGEGFITVRFEHYLKKRYDNGEPVILSSNMNREDLFSLYGPTVKSMVEGKYLEVSLEPGDYRKVMRRKMKKEMNYK